VNRAERRRQAKVERQQVPRSQAGSSLQVSLASIKERLQQADSPVEVQEFIAVLVSQGLPLVAREELNVYAAQYHETRAALQDESKMAAVAPLVTNAHAWADAMIDRSPERDRRACRAGCAFCCYLPTVLVTAAEAVHLADWLRRHCSLDELSTIRHRLFERLKAKSASSSSSPTKQPLPCALLQDNRCVAYSARPLKCRGWNSMNHEICEQAYGHGQTTRQIPADAYAFTMGNAVLNGLGDGAAHAGCDGGSYDLSFALARVLDMPDAVQRWRNGERLFAEQ